MRAAIKSHPLVIGRIGNPLSWSRWPEARALLNAALDRSDEEWSEVEAALATEAMQLWIVLDGDVMRAAAVTRSAQTKRGEVIEVYLVGGTGMEDWLAPLNDEIEDDGRLAGFVGMRAWGRRGWRDPLQDLGWKVAAVAYEKAFD